MKAYRIYIALVLALALSGCGSVDSSEDSSREATTTAADSADHALTEESAAETTTAESKATTTTTAPESEAETETSKKTTAATESPAVTTDAQVTAPTFTQTEAAVQTTAPAKATTTASPAPASAAESEMDKLFETANAMYGKSLNEAQDVFEQAYGVSFGYAHEYSLGTQYETDDGDLMDFEHGEITGVNLFVSKNAETFEVLGVPFRYLTISADQERGVYYLFLNTESDYDDLGEAARLRSDGAVSHQMYLDLCALADAYSKGSEDWESDPQFGYYTWWRSPAGTLNLSGTAHDGDEQPEEEYIYIKLQS